MDDNESEVEDTTHGIPDSKPVVAPLAESTNLDDLVNPDGTIKVPSGGVPA